MREGWVLGFLRYEVFSVDILYVLMVVCMIANRVSAKGF